MIHNYKQFAFLFLSLSLEYQFITFDPGYTAFRNTNFVIIVLVKLVGNPLGRTEQKSSRLRNFRFFSP